MKTWYIFTMLLLITFGFSARQFPSPSMGNVGTLDETVRRVTDCSITMLQNEHVVCEFMLSFSLFFPQWFCNRSVMKKGFCLVSVVG